MDYFVYIIQSEIDGSYYVGSTYNLQLRLSRHNEGWAINCKSFPYAMSFPISWKPFATHITHCFSYAFHLFLSL
ncbi:MAG: GIY-YIG nuclease family protein [Bacteroidota bacterium]